MTKDSTSTLFELFAALLEYPSSTITDQVQHSLEQIQPVHAKVAEKMGTFIRAIAQLPLERIQEVYTTTFDMQPVCYPYVGYHLFGEGYKRGAFMAQLNDAFHAFGYSAGQELPDHLAVILRFLRLDSANRQGEFCQALLKEGIQPALEKMLKVFGEESENPYLSLLSALSLFLVLTSEMELSHA